MSWPWQQSWITQGDEEELSNLNCETPWILSDFSGELLCIFIIFWYKTQYGKKYTIDFSYRILSY